MAFAIVAAAMARFLPLLLCVGAALAACTRDEPRAVSSAAIPAQHRDPELRKDESASAGASRSAGRAAPAGVTDLGREAEREEEEHLKRQKAAQQ